MLPPTVSLWPENELGLISHIDGPVGYHTKLSKSERKRQIPYDITYMWNLKCHTSELIYKID